MTQDEKYMRQAIRQAKKAEALGEVPIGCVIEHEGKIIARGYNRRMTDHSALAHAVLDMLHEEGFNHQAETESGVLGEECSTMMKNFFKKLRENKNEKREGTT